MNDRIFEDHAPSYTEVGYWPRPIQDGTKACKVRGWQKSDPEIPEGERIEWPSRYSAHGIGLLLGSPLPDRTLLGVLDVDHNDYVRVASVLLGGNPLCGRFGSKGMAYFVRVLGSGKYRQFKFKSESSSNLVGVAEFLCTKRLCVIPPTIHPETGQPYRWTGKSLLDTPYTELPIIEV